MTTLTPEQLHGLIEAQQRQVDMLTQHVVHATQMVTELQQNVDAARRGVAALQELARHLEDHDVAEDVP